MEFALNYSFTIVLLLGTIVLFNMTLVRQNKSSLKTRFSFKHIELNNNQTLMLNHNTVNILQSKTIYGV